MLWNQFLDDRDRSFVFFLTNYFQQFISASKFDFGILIVRKNVYFRE
jgi:hypothetical protein